jgi:hypothetical protein
MPRVLRDKVIVTMHLPGGYTKVSVEPPDGVHSNAAVTIDIPTDIIPAHLRAIGSRFFLATTTLSGKSEAERMTPEKIRNVQTMSVEEIKE